MTQVLMVIPPEQFRDEEYEHPKRVLEAAGIRVTTASTRAGRCIGKLGMIAEADLALRDVADAEYDGIVFVGGGGASVFFDDERAHEVARAFLASGRAVAAICIAPSTLARAGLLSGRRATAFPSQENDLVAHGALWTGADIEVDGLVITANGPAAAEAFGNAIVTALART